MGLMQRKTTRGDPVKAIQEAIDKRGCSQRELARLVGTTDGQLSRILSGERKPGLKLALAIQRELGISANGWVDA